MSREYDAHSSAARRRERANARRNDGICTLDLLSNAFLHVVDQKGRTCGITKVVEINRDCDAARLLHG
jgi:hypothetical protein